MISKLYKLWMDKGFEFLIYLSIIAFVILVIYRKITHQRGSYSKNLVPLYESILMLDKRSPNSPSQRSRKESSGEIECKRVLESIFQQPFPKARPDFLSNDITGGNNLELDCFNRDLSIAVEYNGRQHYEYIPYFHKTKDAFYNQKYRDAMKKRLCEENGISLIIVPYTVKVENIRSFIRNELYSRGLIK